MTRFDKIKNTTCVANRQKANDATDIKNRGKNRSRAGFTITEVLLVVAILVVLFAVTIIGISSYQASLRQKELDSKAEVIYMAAQNRLTELAASGREDLYQPETKTMDSTGIETTTGHSDVTEIDIRTESFARPIDMAASASTSAAGDSTTGSSSSTTTTTSQNTTTITKLCYVDSKDIGATITTPATASVILPESRVEAEIRDNNWVIEFDPTSGSVYGVFYSEESTMSYNPTNFNRYRRKDIRLSQGGATIGYYGGDSVAKVNTKTLEPSMEIVNEEKLTATFTCISPYGNDALTFKITVSDKFGHEWTDTVTPTKNGMRYSYTLTLDDLTSGEKKRFAEVYGVQSANGGGLVPGSDITIKCNASCSNALVQDGHTEDTTNSLFGYDKNDEYNDDENTALIEYARHLQNLDEASGVNKNLGNIKITKAVQIKDIHFDNDEENLDDWYVAYSNMQFNSIQNNVLTSYSGSYTDGADTKEYVIYGLNTTSGLFETFSGTELKDIKLSGTTITASSSDSNDASGAIVGSVDSTNLTVSGCQVYLSQAYDKLDTKDEDDIWIQGSDYVGGLIGHVAGTSTVSITDSFASTVLGTENARYTGGLVGYAASSANIRISTSYADSYFYGKKVGGLVGGGSSNITVANSYVAGFTYGSVESAGFTTDGLSSATKSYSILAFKGKSTTNYGIAKSCGSTSYVYFINRAAISDKSVGTEKNTSALTEDAILTSLGNEFTLTTGAAETSAYNLMDGMNLTEYEFPRIAKLTHYGDWETSIISGKLVYYEEYEGGEYGVAASKSTLKDNKVVVGDGYGIIYDEVPSGTVAIKYYAGKDNEATENVNISSASDYETVTIDSKTYYLVKLPAKIVNTAYAPNDFYQQITVGEDVYYYNPHFANTVTSTKPANDTALASATSTISIRTARQLYSLSLYYGSYGAKTRKSTYTQGLDINYGKYDWANYYVDPKTNAAKTVSSQGPIGVSSDEYKFYAKYEGNYKKIEGVSFVNPNRGEYYAGMFGNNAGTLTNIAIVWDYDGSATRTVGLTAPITGGAETKAYIGTLAGVNTKYIRNCAVTGYTMTLQPSEGTYAYIGGMVGKNDGTISNSYADTPIAKLEIDRSNTYFGGLVGENAHIIQNCYAQTYVDITKAEGDSLDSIKISGFVGTNDNVIKNSYCGSALNLTGKANGYGFTDGGSVRDCYYLNGGSYFYVGELRPYNIPEVRSGGAKAVTPTQLEGYITSGKLGTAFGAVSSNVEAQYNTKTEENDDGKFCYPAVYKNASGEYVHYGNWVVEADLGGVGLMYWEHEEEGSNEGYHFHYIGVNGSGAAATGSSGSTLCTTHDDEGRITSYGYAYFIRTKSDGTTDGSVTLDSRTQNYGSFGSFGAENETASAAIENQLSGFKVTAYTTGYGTSNTTSHLYLTDDGVNGNGTVVLKYTKDGTSTYYSFSVCPFFADAFSYNGTVTSTNSKVAITTSAVKPTNTSGFGASGKYLETPGTSDNEYEIRSDDQLQYINWNYKQHNATSAVQSSSTTYENKFTYLKYKSGSNETDRTDYCWVQTHDVDNEGAEFTPIGSMYYNIPTGKKGNEGNTYIAYMAGSYDGQSYMIKNIAMSSNHTMVGLFGITIGAQLENIVMYSEEGNVIQINDTPAKDEQWYSVGGLVGFAASGTGTGAVINNCSVSGYTIKDTRTKNGNWGGGSVGGLAGSCNMDISNCSAVNNIVIAASYNDGEYKNLRVGGLIGNLRATVDSCYSGGTITSTNGSATCSINDQNGTCIWLGGINGGIVMINYGDLNSLIGAIDKDVVISNSYTYVKMDKAGTHQIKYTSPIGSLGEMYCTAFAGSDVPNRNVTILNCYAYDEYAKDTYNYSTWNTSNYWKGASYFSATSTESNVSYTRTLKLNNNGKSPFVSYDQLSASASDANGVLSLLNKNGVDCSLEVNGTTVTAKTANFDFVTTVENDTAVDGKYSFPGNDDVLNGANYPFPAILTQNNSFGQQVYVHYGTWPRGSLNWSKARLSFDLLEAYYSNSSSPGSSNITLTVGGTTTKVKSFTSLDEFGNEITDTTKIVAQVDDSKTTSSTTAGDRVYSLFIKGLRAGTGKIRAELTDGSYRDLKVIITAEMIMSANPQSVTVDPPVGLKDATYEDVSLACVSPTRSNDSTGAAGADYTRVAEWTFEVSDDDIAKVTDLGYDSTTGKRMIRITGKVTGDTIVKATATYNVTIDGVTKPYSKDVTISVTVTDPTGSSTGN